LIFRSRLFVFEPTPGMKATVLENLSSVTPTDKGPMEKNRVFFILAWLHAIIQERLRYTPIGWSKLYEFNDADLDCALAVASSWIESSAQGRSNVCKS
jgi:dynein heavy chain 1